MFLPNDYFVCHHIDYIKGSLGPLRQDGDHGYSIAECCPSRALPLAGPGPFLKISPHTKGRWDGVDEEDLGFVQLVNRWIPREGKRRPYKTTPDMSCQQQC